jgi:hypothetical protein
MQNLMGGGDLCLLGITLFFHLPGPQSIDE